MNNCDKLNEINRITTKYTEEEFKEVLKIFPTNKLIEVIKRNPKEFINEIKGFRVEKLPIKIIQEIYFKRIYKENNMLMAKVINSIERDIISDVCSHIGNDKIKKNLISGKFDNINEFRELIDVLLQTRFKDYIKLFFMVVEYKLTEEQAEYIENDVKRILLEKEIQKKIRLDLDVIHKEEIKAIEEKYKIQINNKSLEIKSLNEKVMCFENAINKKDEEIFKQKNEEKIVLKKLEDSFNKRENYLNNKIIVLEEKQNKLVDDNKKLTKENSKLNDKIIMLEDVIEEKYIGIKDIYSEKLSQDTQKILAEKQILEDKLEKINYEIDIKTTELQEMDNFKEELEQAIKVVENNAGTVIENITKLLRVINKQEKKISVDTCDIYNKEIMELNKDLNELDEIEYFIEDLSENLIISGIDSKFSIDLAYYIYGILSSNLSLVLVGYNGRRVANAISRIIQGKDAQSLVLPLGYTNFKELIDIINESSSKVIIIENSIDTMTESLYLTLIKEKLDKYIIFSMESFETFNILPGSVFNYVMFIDLDTIYDYEHSKEFIECICSENIFKVKGNDQSKKRYVKKLKKIKSIANNSIVAKHKIAEVLSIIELIGAENSFYDFIVFSLLMIYKAVDKIDELVELVESEILEADCRKNLLSIIRDNDYE
mgnify:CR=1 FL=1